MRMNEKALACSEDITFQERTITGNHVLVAGVVDSLLHPMAILIRQVLTRSGRQELNLLLVDDEENIIQALDAGIEIHSLYYCGHQVISTQLLQKLPQHVGIYEVARRTCKKLFENDKSSRVFAIAHTPSPGGLDSLLSAQRDIVALEDLSISGNIGAIVRTSFAFGVGSIILLNAQPVDIYDRRLIRASRGHVFSLPVVTATTDELIQFCKHNGLPLLIMAVQADQDVDQAAFGPEPYVIALGSEKGGCSQALMDAAALKVQIPTNAGVDSLNVSTAAAIMLYKRFWFNHPARK